MHYRVLSLQANLLLILPLAFLATVFGNDVFLSLYSVNFLKTSRKGFYSEIENSPSFQLLPSHTNSSGLYRSTYYVQIKRYLVNSLCLHKCRFIHFANIKSSDNITITCCCFFLHIRLAKELSIWTTMANMYLEDTFSKASTLKKTQQFYKSSNVISPFFLALMHALNVL